MALGMAARSPTRKRSRSPPAVAATEAGICASLSAAMVEGSRSDTEKLLKRLVAGRSAASATHLSQSTLCELQRAAALAAALDAPDTLSHLLECLKRLFKTSVSTSDRDDVVRAAGQAAVQAGAGRALRVVLQQRRGNLGQFRASLLRQAASLDAGDCVKQLLLALRDQPDLGPGGRAPLHMAAAAGATDAVSLLLGAGAAPGAADSEGWTPLHYACAGRHPAVVGALLRGGADPRAVAVHGVTPLHEACGSPSSGGCGGGGEEGRGGPGAREVVNLLLSGGADVNARTSYSGFTPLHVAAMDGDAEAARALMDCEARVDQRAARGGETPLILASRTGSVAVVRALLERGAKPDRTARCSRRSPLHVAARLGHCDVVEALLAGGASAARLDRDGCSALGEAVAGADPARCVAVFARRARSVPAAALPEATACLERAGMAAPREWGGRLHESRGANEASTGRYSEA